MEQLTLQEKIELAKEVLVPIAEIRKCYDRIAELTSEHMRLVCKLGGAMGPEATPLDMVAFFKEHQSEIGIDDEELERMSSAAEMSMIRVGELIEEMLNRAKRDEALDNMMDTHIKFAGVNLAGDTLNESDGQAAIDRACYKARTE